MLRLLLLLLLSIPTLLASSAREVVLATIEHAVIPAYQQAVARADELAVAAEGLAAAPDQARLQAARAAWHAAKDAWERAEPLTLGRAWLQRYQVDFWPTRERTIASALRGQDPIDRAAVAEFGAAAKGLPALGWLLHARASDAEILAQPRRLAYIQAAAQVLAEDLRQMSTQWNGLAPEQRLALVASTGGRPELTGADAQEALDGLLNSLLAATGRAVASQLEKPLGSDKGPRPQQVESVWSGRGLRDLARNLEGVRWGLGGSADGETAVASILGLLDQRVAGAGAGAQQAAQAAGVAAEQLAGADLAGLVVDAPETLQPLLEALRTLRVELKTRATGVLGVTIYFGDSDGD